MSKLTRLYEPAKKPTRMEELLGKFLPISLNEMTGIRLMNRTDTKFVTNRALLERLLGMACGEYRAQEIDGVKWYKIITSKPVRTK